MGLQKLKVRAKPREGKLRARDEANSQEAQWLQPLQAAAARLLYRPLLLTSS